MKKKMTAFAIIIAALLAAAGCGRVTALPAETSATASRTEEVSAGASSDNAATLAAVEAVEATVTKRDASGEYDASEAVVLDPAGDLTIRAAGVYLLSGSYTKTVVVDAGEEDKVQLVLQNADLAVEDGPAIYVKSADKVFLTAAAGTVNTVSDGESYTFTDSDTSVDAAVFSKEDLTVNGTGTLTITGNQKHAVVSKDDLTVTASDLTVIAAKAGLNGKDSVTLSGATVSIRAGSDGIRSDNDTDAAKGTVQAANSVITIEAGNDGIQAETAFAAADCEITVTSGGGSTARAADSSESYKGIKAGTSVTLAGGTYTIDSLDDAVHANGTVLISGGEYILTSGDDGIHADERAEVSDGKLTITAHEGIEGTCVLISGGEITIQASDDGINAARKVSGITPTVEITGGNLTITMGAGDTDGIDSNGDIRITGGTISISGSSAFDYDGSASFTGGTVIVNGQEVTTLPNQMMGGPFGGMGGFPGGTGEGQGGQGGGMGGYGGHGARP